jgi:primosomal protein N' (replication factor Y)
VLAQLGRAGGLFTYGLPEGLAPLVAPGSLVRVPFSSRQLQGVVCTLEETTDLPRVRNVAELLDPVAVLTPHQLRLARWIADYYAAPLSDVMGAMLPPGLGRKTVYVLEPGVEPNGSRLTDDQRRVLDAVQAAGRIQLDEVQRDFPELEVEKEVASLIRRGLVLRMAELAPPRVTARVIRLLSITNEGRSALETGEGLSRAPKQREALTIVAERGSITSADLSRLLPGSQPLIRALETKSYLRVEEHQSRRSPLDRKTIALTNPLHLSAAQQQGYTAIARSIHEGKPDIFLLHGVTGSGKTEVYLQAVAETIRLGRQTIMMVPEISLTPQAVERVAGRFPGRVAVLHSKLSDGERVDEWQRIRHGEVDVVVGPRSALFAPLPHPGMIVLVE